MSWVSEETGGGEEKSGQCDMSWVSEEKGEGEKDDEEYEHDQSYHQSYRTVAFVHTQTLRRHAPSSTTLNDPGTSSRNLVSVQESPMSCLQQFWSLCKSPQDPERSRTPPKRRPPHRFSSSTLQARTKQPTRSYTINHRSQHRRNYTASKKQPPSPLSIHLITHSARHDMRCRSRKRRRDART